MAQNGSRYPSTKAVEADGNAYTIYRGLHMYHIQNKANVMNNEPELKYQDGTSAYGHDTDDRQIVFPEDDIYAIFKDTFSWSELFDLRKERISVGFVVLPDGAVGEVDFWMKHPTEPLLAIPIERFARLEKGLKKLKLKVGPITRKLRFNWASFTVSFAKIPFDRPPLKPDPGVIRKDVQHKEGNAPQPQASPAQSPRAATTNSI